MRVYLATQGTQIQLSVRELRFHEPQSNENLYAATSKTYATKSKVPQLRFSAAK